MKISSKGLVVWMVMVAGMSLLAYHLPLDAHAEYGNNRQLGLRLGFDQGAVVDGLLWGAELSAPMNTSELVDRVASGLGREPLTVGPADATLRRVAWCSGAAQGMITQAAAAGFDAFISGEISEQTVHEANELGVVYLAAGHHATERYGVQSLGAVLADRFGVRHRFIDLDNPV